MDLSTAWAIIALAFVVIVPLLNETWDLFTAFKVKHKVDCEEETLVTTTHHVVEPQTRPHVHHGVVTTSVPSPTERCFSNIAVHSQNGGGGENGEEKAVTVVAAAAVGGDSAELKRHGDGDISYVENGRSGDEPDVALETRGPLEEAVTEGDLNEVETCESEDSAKQSVF